MTLCIVPMKPLDRAKGRLAEVLSPRDRRVLSLAMLSDVVRAATAAADVWVLCSDPEAAELAARAGAIAAPDPAPAAGLNISIDLATEQAIAAGAGGVLILAADCPAVREDDVRAMLVGEGIGICPDRSGAGTNALWRSPPDVVPAAFGLESRHAFETLARERGVPCAVVRRERLAADVDRPDDLAEIARIGPGPATVTALESLGYPSPRR